MVGKLLAQLCGAASVVGNRGAGFYRGGAGRPPRGWRMAQVMPARAARRDICPGLPRPRAALRGLGRGWRHATSQARAATMTASDNNDAGSDMNPTMDADFDFIRDPSRRRLAPMALRRADPDAEITQPAPPKHRVAAQQEQIVFWDFPSSPFCVKVRAILNWKGVQFRAVDPLQPGRWWQLQRRGVGKVPALDIDGRFVIDSTDIAHELERLFPDRPLLPRDPRHQAACHLLEDWADESLYFIGLYFIWLHPGNASTVAPLFGRDLLGRLAFRLYRARIDRQVRGQGTGRKTAEHIERDLARHLKAAERMLEGRRFLLGDEPLLCDFALFGQLTFLLRSVASAPFVKQCPALMRYVDRMRVISR